MEEKVEFIKEIKIDETTVTLRKDGIVHVLFHRNVVIDPALQMFLLNIYKEVAGEKKYPFLFEALTGVKYTKEARDNAFRIESEAPGTAYAVVAPSLVYKTIANFYIKTKKLSVPYKVFSKKENAVKWLKTYL